MKLVKLALVLLFLLAFVGFIIAILWFEVTGFIFSISPALYWFILPGWGAVIYYLKLKSNATFKLAFIAYTIGAILIVLGLRQMGIAEVILRLAYLWFGMATLQAIWEYKNV